MATLFVRAALRRLFGLIIGCSGRRCGTHPLNCETSEYANFTASSNVSEKVGHDARKRRGQSKIGERARKFNVSQYGQVITQHRST